MSTYKYFSKYSNIVSKFIELYGNGKALNSIENDSLVDFLYENDLYFLCDEGDYSDSLDNYIEVGRFEETDSYGVEVHTKSFTNFNVLIKNDDLNKLFLLKYSADIIDYCEYSCEHGNFEGDIFVFDLTSEMLEFFDTYNKEECDYDSKVKAENLNKQRIAKELRAKEKLREKSLKLNLHNELIFNGFTQFINIKGNKTNQYIISLDGLRVEVKISRNCLIEVLKCDNKYIYKITQLFCNLLNQKYISDYKFYSHLPYVSNIDVFINSCIDKCYIDVVNSYIVKVNEGKIEYSENFASLINEINNRFL